jgi:hypothetical protein
MKIETGKLVHTWGRLRPLSAGATLAEHKLRKHPRVRPALRTFLGADQAYLRPLNPSSLAGLNRGQQAARRLRELAQDAADTGAGMGRLAVIIQKAHEYSSEQAWTGVDLFRSPDDAAAIGSDAGDNFNSLSIALAAGGPLAAQPANTPALTLSAALRDWFKAEFQAAGLACPGHNVYDDERGHEPWNWAKPAGGVWDAMLAAAWASGEILADAADFIGDPPPESPGYTLETWNENHAPAAEPQVNQGWSSAANRDAGWTAAWAKLRAESMSSQHGRVTRAVWKADPYFAGMKFYNYESSVFNRPGFGITTFGGGGSGDADHTVDYSGHDGSSPILYPYNLSNGDLDPVLARFGPPGAKGPGNYDARRAYGNARRTMTAINASDGRLRPCFPWVRGAETPTSLLNPAHTAADLAAMTRLVFSFPNCDDAMWWYNDNPDSATPAHGVHLAAVELLFPEFVWSDDADDWVVAG